MLTESEKIYHAFGGNPYQLIRCEFYKGNILFEEFECKAWEAIDKAVRFLNENENTVMYFFKMSKMDLICQ